MLLVSLVDVRGSRRGINKGLRDDPSYFAPLKGYVVSLIHSMLVYFSSFNPLCVLHATFIFKVLRVTPFHGGTKTNHFHTVFKTFSVINGPLPTLMNLFLCSELSVNKCFPAYNYKSTLKSKKMFKGAKSNHFGFSLVPKLN